MSDVVLVTGASSEVGAAVLSRLAATPATIYAQYAHSPEKLFKQIEGLSGQAQFVPVRADFRSCADTESLIETIAAAHVRPNKILHLSAIPLSLQRFGKLDWDELQADIEVSLRSITLLARAFLPVLARERCSGRVVVMLSSVTVGTPPKGMAAYTIVKFALLGMVRALAAEFADSGITVNAVSPYTMETPFLARLPHKYVELAAAQNPQRRNATPEDVVSSIQMLLSDEARFVTGSNIVVAGGAVF